MYEVIDEVVFNKCDCDYCGKQAETVIFEECCTGPIIDCCCNGQAMPRYFCYQCQGLYQLEKNDLTFPAEIV